MIGLWPHVQQKLNHPWGDCVRTCYAALFELPIEDVPDFSPGALNGRSQREAERAWLRTLGLDLKTVRQPPRQPPLKVPPNLVHLMSIRTKRPHHHRVIARGGKIIHDPYPKGSTLVGVNAYYFLIPLP